MGKAMVKPTQRQKAWALYAQGYDVNSNEIAKVVPRYKTRGEYWRRWQKAGMPGYVGTKIVEAEPDTTVEAEPDTTAPPQGSEADTDTKPASSGSTTRFRIDQAKEANEVADCVAASMQSIGFHFWTFVGNASKPKSRFEADALDAVAL